MRIDESLLKGYQDGVAEIARISKDRESLSHAVDGLAERQGIPLRSASLESRILEFLLAKQSVTKGDLDILIAYQLMGRFEGFVKNSNDKLAASADPETVHMVQILALLQEYGDPLKECVRKLERAALQADSSGTKRPDADFLLSRFGRKAPKEVSDLTKDRVIDSLVKSFSRRPAYAITDIVIRKSILEKCKSVLQNARISQEEQEEFAKSFQVRDFM
jgi:hypothetical protein